MKIPTPQQVREGRDEALEHLGIDAELWDGLSPRAQYEVLISRIGDATDFAAAETVIDATEPRTLEVVERFLYHAILPYRGARKRSNYTLVA